MLGIKEWNLDTIMFTYLWSPFKWFGKKLHFLQSPFVVAALIFCAVAFLLLKFVDPAMLESVHQGLPLLLMMLALAVILFSFTYRKSAVKAWLYLLVGHFFIITAVVFNAVHINTIEIVYYVSGVLLAFFLGYYCLQKIKAIDNDISLTQFHGYVYEEETTGLLFLFAAIGMLGFPITTAFIGIDVLFTYVHHNQPVLIILMALCFIFIELAAFRILLRIFFGPHKKLNHPVAFRSS